MIFERTMHGEVVALARLLNVPEAHILDIARENQPHLRQLEDMDGDTYGLLMAFLIDVANHKEVG